MYPSSVSQQFWLDNRKSIPGHRLSSSPADPKSSQANLPKHKVNTNLAHFISSGNQHQPAALDMDVSMCISIYTYLSVHTSTYIYNFYIMYVLTNHLGISQVEVLHDVDKRINVLRQARIELLLLGNGRLQLAPRKVMTTTTGELVGWMLIVTT